MKKFMSIAMTAIAGICLLSIVGCGQEAPPKAETPKKELLKVKMQRPDGALGHGKNVWFYVNGENLLPYGVDKTGRDPRNSSRINVTHVNFFTWDGYEHIYSLEFTVEGLESGDEIQMKLGVGSGAYITPKVEVKNKKKIVFREWSRE